MRRGKTVTGVRRGEGKGVEGGKVEEGKEKMEKKRQC